MDAAGVVRELWTRAQARDWEGVGELVAQDAVIEWPVSSERIIGRANYVAVNREYPEGWAIRILKVIGSGDQVASEVEVLHASMGTFREPCSTALPHLAPLGDCLSLDGAFDRAS